jgi:predicted alpha/beta-fold hydrolase
MDLVYDDKNERSKTFVNQHLQPSDAYVTPFAYRVLPYGNYVEMYLLRQFSSRYQLPDVETTHQVFDLPDGGKTCILIMKPGVFDANTPILLVFPTLTSHGQIFACMLKHVLKEKGWAVIILNKRGQHCPLSTFDLHLTGEDHDTEIVVQSVLDRYRTNPIVAFGMSAGAIMMTRYLGKFQPPRILAAVAACGAYDLDMIQEMEPVAQRLMKREIMNNYKLPPANTPEYKECTEALRRWSEDESANILDVLNITMPGKCRTTLEREFGLSHVLPTIQIPCLFIHAQNDPVFPNAWKRADRFRTMRNTIFVHTHGGSHGAYLTSSFSYGSMTWLETKAIAFLAFHLSCQGSPRSSTFA